MHSNLMIMLTDAAGRMRRSSRLMLLHDGEALQVAVRAESAAGFFARLRGLMFRARFGPGDALALLPCGSIHTFFMRFAIDAVCVDGASRVVDAASGLRPWRFFFPKGRPLAIVELPEGTIRRCGIRTGDVLLWENAV